MDIAAWLRGLGLGQYESAFRANDVDAQVLPRLTAEDLISIGVTSVGHRGRFRSVALRFLAFSLASLGDPGCTRSLAHAKEPGTRPMCPGDLLGNHGQRAIVPAVVFEPVLAHEDGMSSR